jgi:hypothetical protein
MYFLCNQHVCDDDEREALVFGIEPALLITPPILSHLFISVPEYRQNIHITQ